jgi:hypothetical protein
MLRNLFLTVAPLLLFLIKVAMAAAVVGLVLGLGKAKKPPE